MKSKEGIIWQWKNDSNDTLFIFRNDGQEVKVIFNTNYSIITFSGNRQLTDLEKQFLTDIAQEFKQNKLKIIIKHD